jgi:hypothetical protein
MSNKLSGGFESRSGSDESFNEEEATFRQSLEGAALSDKEHLPDSPVLNKKQMKTLLSMGVKDIFVAKADEGEATFLSFDSNTIITARSKDRTFDVKTSESIPIIHHSTRSVSIDVKSFKDYDLTTLRLQNTDGTEDVLEIKRKKISPEEREKRDKKAKKWLDRLRKFNSGKDLFLGAVDKEGKLVVVFENPKQEDINKRFSVYFGKPGQIKMLPVKGAMRLRDGGTTRIKLKDDRMVFVPFGGTPTFDAEELRRIDSK